jgi:hypothetical protein
VLLCACGSGAIQAASGDGGSPDVPQQAQLCPACLTDADCNGAVCAQFQGDIFCAPACGAAGECPSGRSCRIASSAAGQQVSICEPASNACGNDVTPGGDGGATVDAALDAASSQVCGTLVGPSVPATCHSCSGGADCQPNGCYGGWWCDTATKSCHAPPTTCSPSPPADAGPPPPPPAWDAGVEGNVGPNGGTLSRLVFAVVGDTRPATIDDTSGYPTNIIGPIYQHMAAMSPPPPFAIATGDYMFSNTYSNTAGPQLDLYLAARNAYPNPVFPALGNHECTGATDSNCGPGATNGSTSNYQAFMSKLLAPMGKQQPYYSFNVNATDGSWTAKFVFIAANAWTSAQGTWLEQTLATPTTYTFVIRHEPTSATTAPGVNPSQQIINAHPYTLLLVGHTHTYGRSGAKQVIIGNGGAPITGSGNYGWALLQQRPDGAIQVDMLDYQTSQPDTSFRFAVKADGTAAP